MDALLEAKLRELIDRQEIWAVLLRYARGLDRMDRELLRSCYWDDAIDDHHGYVGSPDFFIDTTFGNTSSIQIEHHGLSNHFCELDGDDAYGETHYTFFGTRNDAPALLSIGRYIDHFQRRDGVWKFSNRVTVIERNFALAAYPCDAQILAGDTRPGPLLPATRDRSDLSYMQPVVPRRPAVD